ncbi:hypothetical protein IID22_05225 [Patescibacteria group bacterium]|nr:hypothetical protein [Patescibacteria group bacterium]
MTDIKIKSRTNNLGYHFNVEVVDEKGSTSHRVTMDRDFVTRIGANYEPEKVVKKSFEFLLAREPKEKILEEFDITIISHYFPDYITKLERMLRDDPSGSA